MWPWVSLHSQAGIHARSRGDPVAPTWKGAQAQKLPSSNQTLASNCFSGCRAEEVKVRGRLADAGVRLRGAIDRTRGEAE